MDFAKSYKSFISSAHVNEGIRMTAGILFPAFLMSYFNLLSIGIILSLGALFVSVTDSPGPIHHRRNGMLVCIVSIFLISIISGLVNPHPILLGITIVLVTFLYTMIGIYGARASSIGIAVLLCLVLNIKQERSGWDMIQYAFYVASGGIWYMCFSMLLYNFRPYKLIQQALGDWIQTIGEYVLIRAALFDKNADYNAIFNQLAQKQSEVQEKQNTVHDLIFKTRSVVKESTHIGRILLMTYVDASDIIERIMTSYQRYSVLHNYFDSTEILHHYKTIATNIGTELDDIGIALKSGTTSTSNTPLQSHIIEAEKFREELRENDMTPDNLEGFISLKRILDNFVDLRERLETLHQYTTYDKKLQKRNQHKWDDSFITHERVTPQLFVDNLTLHSDIFRHAVRLCVAVFVGYITSLLFNIEHSYWILLTIVVILKPAYSLTKKRNSDRLFGTIAGVLIGVLVLQFVENSTALLIIMILFMAANFIFMRKNYFVAVLLMTPYIVLFYHLIHPEAFKNLLIERIIDTAIGSTIAFAVIAFLMPSWERQKIKPLLVKMLEESAAYFSEIKNYFDINGMSFQQIKLSRQRALVALGNLSAAFNRMLSEPKNQQYGAEDIHQFIVLNHVLTSYIASLSAYLKPDTITLSTTDFKKVIEDVDHYFKNAIDLLEGRSESYNLTHKESVKQLNREADILLKKRQEELHQGLIERTETGKTLFNLKSVVDQFNHIYRVALELNKVSKTIASKISN